MSVEAIYHRRVRRGHATVPGVFAPERGRLTRRGRHFYDEDGRIWGERGKSMFLLFRRYAHGEDIEPDLRWLRAYGFNCLRIFGALPWKETPDYSVSNFPFDRLPGFLALLERYGLRSRWSLGHYRHDGLQAYAQRFLDIAQRFWTVTFVQMVNEPHVGAEKPDPVEMLRSLNAHDLLVSYGLYGRYYDRSPGLDPVQDLGELHTQRDSAWVRKARHCQELQMMLKQGQGVDVAVSDEEPAKAIEIGSATDHPPTTAVYPGFRYPGGKTNPDDFARHHAVAALWTPGSTFHDEHGKWGHVPPLGSQQHLCAMAVVEHVWARIGPEWQTGEYNRAGNRDSPVDNVWTEQNQIWTYSSLHAAEGRALAVRCGSIPLRAINGWRIVESWLGGTIARLAR